jgi:hypothetical protein
MEKSALENAISDNVEIPNFKIFPLGPNTNQWTISQNFDLNKSRQKFQQLERASQN